MGYLAVLFALALIGVILPLVFKKISEAEYPDLSKEQAAGASRLVRWVVGLMILVITFAAGFHQIPAGRAGVVYEFGAIVSQVGEGPRWVLPWRSVKQESVQLQRHAFERMDCFSKETQRVLVDCVLNVRVSPRAIQKLYREVGPDWFDKLVASRVQQYFKDETVKYSSVDIAPNREQIRHAVSSRLNEEMISWSIETPDLLLGNIDFEPQFKQAIEDKQKATQDALRAEQVVKTVEWEAQQRRARAEGIRDSITTVADGQATANEKLNRSLTPMLVQYAAVQKIAPGVSWGLLPAGAPFILGSDLVGRK